MKAHNSAEQRPIQLKSNWFPFKMQADFNGNQTISIYTVQTGSSAESQFSSQIYITMNLKAIQKIDFWPSFPCSNTRMESAYQNDEIEGAFAKYIMCSTQMTIINLQRIFCPKRKKIIRPFNLILNT